MVTCAQGEGGGWLSGGEHEAVRQEHFYEKPAAPANQKKIFGASHMGLSSRMEQQGADVLSRLFAFSYGRLLITV